MDERLKQRLVGAVVLVVAAVLFVPMIVGDPDEDTGTAGTPAAVTGGTRDFSSHVTPLDDPGAARAAPPASAPDPMANRSVDRQPATRSPRPAAPVSSPRTAATPAPRRDEGPAKPAARAADSGVRWVVQLASFSDRANATALRRKLESRGFSAFVEPGAGGKEAFSRILVGPYDRREKAVAAVGDLEAATRLRGIVLKRGD